jgi:hypothetical protein
VLGIDIQSAPSLLAKRILEAAAGIRSSLILEARINCTSLFKNSKNNKCNTTLVIFYTSFPYPYLESIYLEGGKDCSSGNAPASEPTDPRISKITGHSYFTNLPKTD